MKIKLFEQFEEEKPYFEVSHSYARDELKRLNSKKIILTEREFDEIGKYFNFKRNSIYVMGYVTRPDLSSDLKVVVVKMEDEWFLVNAFSRSKLVTSYKCDQLYGLEECLKMVKKQ